MSENLLSLAQVQLDLRALVAAITLPFIRTFLQNGTLLVAGTGMKTPGPKSKPFETSQGLFPSTKFPERYARIPIEFLL